MSSTEKFLKLAGKAGVPYEIYTGSRIDKGNGQGGCYWSGNNKKLMVWNQVSSKDIAHELGHYFAVKDEKQFSINNYGLDLDIFDSMEQERNACLLHFHLCDIFEVPRDTIETDMYNCSFLEKQTTEQVFKDAEDTSNYKFKEVVLLARKIQGEYDTLNKLN